MLCVQKCSREAEPAPAKVAHMMDVCRFCAVSFTLQTNVTHKCFDDMAVVGYMPTHVYTTS